MKKFSLMAALLLLLFSPLALADPFLGFGWGGGIIGLIVFILAIIAILDVLKSGKPTEQKILWVLVILLLPLIGLILYYVIGK